MSFARLALYITSIQPPVFISLIVHAVVHECMVATCKRGCHFVCESEMTAISSDLMT